ncbi:hypothetical protein A5886_000914 [Enterococcus sp. 8G7_MSG3316]|uniref:Uncharacterized protein n=1 Tax=Candidatus Enterococcus testudinis TaxID=1834191 RepID=A0A242A468_9ENTE|nr:hypothetical protein [Enterococcus sp. 8G7_MSG3316]OTN75838.1 hypothetical protein A5886_000914 [Enterococcus sp. 8G7_MSG3316]
MAKDPWYKQKKVYIPITIVLGVLGIAPSLVSLFGVSIDDELNPDYYTDPDQELFRKKK